MEDKPLLEIKKLRTHFQTKRGWITAVDDVSFALRKGEIIGVVGESGSGKTVTSQSILRLYDEKSVRYEGEILFEGTDLLKLSHSNMRQMRGNEISMIFQDPLSALNPVFTIGNQIIESLRLHQKMSKEKAYSEAIRLLELTGIPSPEMRINEYPHELSGGMRQRVMIAMALACRPKLLIADEPTTALDVTIQSQILDLIIQLNKDLQMGVIFITHDLGVVAEICTRVVVMYLGQIVEEGNIESIFNSPLHPYTKGLMKSIPQLDGDREEELYVIEGNVPSLHDIPIGCRFHNRCSFANELCLSKMPELQTTRSGQKVRCWHYEKILEQEQESYANN